MRHVESERKLSRNFSLPETQVWTAMRSIPWVVWQLLLFLPLHVCSVYTQSTALMGRKRDKNIQRTLLIKVLTVNFLHENKHFQLKDRRSLINDVLCSDILMNHTFFVCVYIYICIFVWCKQNHHISISAIIIATLNVKNETQDTIIGIRALLPVQCVKTACFKWTVHVHILIILR